MIGFFSRLSIFQKNLLFSGLNILVLGAIFTLASYYMEDKLMVDVISQQAKGVASQSVGILAPADVKEALTNHDLGGPLQKRLISQLDSISQTNKTVAQSYLFEPFKGAENKQMVIAVPSHIIKDGLPPGTMYEQPENFAAAERAMMESKQMETSKVYTDQFGTWISVAVPILDEQKNLIAVFGLDIDATIIAEGKKQMLMLLGGTLIGFLILSSIAQFLITRRILAPLKGLFRAVNELGTGNLDVQMEIKGQDEISELGRSFNATVEQLRQAMVQVKETSHKVGDSSRRFVEIADQTSEASNRITISVQEVAAGLEEQMSSSEESAQTTEFMAFSMQRIAENSEQASSASTNASTEAQEGNLFVQNAIKQMESINTSVNESAAIVQSMNQRSQDIELIVSAISDISSQTNLLALNAAIEASRAGEQGRGFAVVADEVRKLAEQSAVSARQITDLIKGMQGDSQLSVQSMNKVTSEVKLGLTEMQAVGKVFKRIIDAIEDINVKIHEMASASKMMSEGAGQMSASVSTMTEIARDSAERSQEVAASSQEQLALVEEISESANSLNQMSQELQELVSKFKV